MSGSIRTGGRALKPEIVNGKVLVRTSRPVDYRRVDCTLAPRIKGTKDEDAAARQPEIRKSGSRDGGSASRLALERQREIIRKQRELIQDFESNLGMGVILLLEATPRKNYGLCSGCNFYLRNITEFSNHRCGFCGTTSFAISPENLRLPLVKREYDMSINCPVCHSYHLDVKLGIYECRRKKLIVH